MHIEKQRIDGYRNRFVNRADTYAQQLPDGSYIRQKEPVSDHIIHQHLEGSITVGLYAVARDNTAKWGVLDADTDDGLARLSHAWLALDKQGIPAHLEQSRRGGHLWLLMEQPIPAEGVRDLLHAAVLDLDELELFPKQDRLDPRRLYGSLVRGPLGTHLKSGRKYPFVDAISLRPVANSVGATVDYLLEAQTVSIAKAAEVVAGAKRTQPPKAPEARSVYEQPSTQERAITPVELAKQRLGDPLSFIGQYTELSATGKGCCPFHSPDHNPSFSVNPNTGRWTDFHVYFPEQRRYDSGDTLDFYARINGVTIKEAIRDILMSTM
jgi:hypothetical protein